MATAPPDRTLVITVRPGPPPIDLEVWLTLYDGGEVDRGNLLGIRGPIDLESLPFSAADILREVFDLESSRFPRLF